MQSRKVGLSLLLLSVACAVLLFVLIGQLQSERAESGCVAAEGCEQLDRLMWLLHAAIGLVSFLLALGAYILFFYRDERDVLRVLDKEKEQKLSAGRFDLMLRMLNDQEQKVLRAIAEQDGIEQNTLRLRTGLSRSLVSEIVQSFERKGLVERSRTGKTFRISLRERIE